MPSAIVAASLEMSHGDVEQSAKMLEALAEHKKIVLYMLDPGESIPREIHDDSDQELHVIRGRLDVIVHTQSGRVTHEVPKGLIFTIASGTDHTVTNSSNARATAWSVYYYH